MQQIIEENEGKDPEFRIYVIERLASAMNT
jgi:hypothetical protein